MLIVWQVVCPPRFPSLSTLLVCPPARRGAVQVVCPRVFQSGVSPRWRKVVCPRGGDVSPCFLGPEADWGKGQD